jgi:hypothetical protein
MSPEFATCSSKIGAICSSKPDLAWFSYPLLVGPGPSRVQPGRRWLANRTFIANDTSGRIILGTTKEVIFFR